MTLDRDQIIKNLQGRIDDSMYKHIQQFFPISTICPTCDDEKVYRLDGVEHPCDCELQKLLQKHYFAANIGREYHDINLDNFIGSDRPTVVATVEDYLATFKARFHYGIGISISGPVGTGKTLAMSCILKELVKQGVQVYSIPFEEMINIWGSAYQDAEIKRRLEEQLKSVHVLGLDEVRTDGRNRVGFLSQGFDSVIRHRTANLLPTIITTNMTPIEEEKEFGKVYSLLSARNLRIETTGKDLRMGPIRYKILELARANERRPIS